MSLNKTDRLILLNQYEILKNINPDNKKEYENFQKILEEGYTKNYHEFLGSIGEETSEEVQEFVYRVLEMFRALNGSYIQLSDSDKAQIDFEDIIYQGFDGNSETKYYMYANFLLEDLKYYAESLKNSKGELNSHSNKIGTYLKMLEVWDSLPDKITMSLESIKKLIDIN